MKINPRTAIERNGVVMTGPFETDEQHGRVMIRKGYATLVDETPAKTHKKSKPKDTE